MGRHREELIERLNHVIGRLDRGFGHREMRKLGINVQITKKQYGELKAMLLEVDREAVDVLTRMSPWVFFRLTDTCGCTESHSSFMCALPLPCP